MSALSIEESHEPQLAGRWRTSSGKMHIIGIDAVLWQSGEITSLRKRRRYNGERRVMQYATELGGVMYTAHLSEDGQLHWSDGDIWMRDDRGPETGTYAAVSGLLGEVISVMATPLTSIAGGFEPDPKKEPKKAIDLGEASAGDEVVIDTPAKEKAAGVIAELAPSHVAAVPQTPKISRDGSSKCTVSTASSFSPKSSQGVTWSLDSWSLGNPYAPAENASDTHRSRSP